MDMIHVAERIARAAHAGQVDKVGLAYIDHPRRVAGRVAEVDGRPSAIAAAWLHDVVEDTPTTLEDLRVAGLPADVVAAVDALTRRVGEGEAYYRRVAANELATAVKRADIWDNTDPGRLAKLDESDRRWLEDKYRHASAAISAAAEIPDPVDL